MRYIFTSEAESERWAKIALCLVIVLICLFALFGCSILDRSSIDRSVDRCIAFGGMPEYTKAGGAESFKCGGQK